MSDRDFEIAGRKFKLNKMDVFKQFHVVRRLAPIIGDLIAVGQTLKDKDPESFSEEQLKLFSPIMTGLAKLSDEDANLILLGLCSCVEVQQMPLGNWARIANAQCFMIQDLELPILFQVAGRAFLYNLSGFSSALPAR